MRVLHVITGLAAGGAEHQLRLLLRHRQTDAEVVTLTNPGSVAREIRNDGTPVHHLGMRGNRDLTALPRLVRLIRRGRFDLVHTHLYRACVYGRIAARLAGVRHVVATEHSLGDEHIEGRQLSSGVRRLYLATERLGQSTIAVSPTVARRLVAWGVPASRIDLIPNGIDATGFRFDPVHRARIRDQLAIAPERFVVGSVGRLVPGKQTGLMLSALEGVPGVTALVVGDGPQRQALAALARQLNVEVIFTGETTNVPAHLWAMDVLIATSAEETFGLSVIEALAAGLPVLYVECPALDDLPAGAVPGARRLPADARVIRQELAGLMLRGPQRLPPPAALDRYDIAEVAARTYEVYRRVTCRAAQHLPVASNEGGPMAAAAKIWTWPDRRWWLIGLLTILGVLGGLVYGLARDPVYTAKAYVVVVAEDSSDSMAVSYAQAYARIADEGAALDAAAEAGNATASVDELRRQVRATASPDAPVIELTGSAGSADRAAYLANLVADGLVSAANKHRGDTRVRLTVLSAALPPIGPTSPSLALSVAVGAAVGLLLGGLALLGGTGRSGRRREHHNVAVADGRPWTGHIPVAGQLAPMGRGKAQSSQLDDGDRSADDDPEDGTQGRLDGGMASPDPARGQRA